MKIAKIFAGLFGAAGTVLLLVSIGLCLFSLNAPVYMEEVPSGAVECSELLSGAISRKEYKELENCIYGQPELGLTGEPEEELTRMTWELLQMNLEFSWQGDVYLQDSVLQRDASVRYLDAASITQNLQARAHALLTQRVEEATDMEDLYDGGGEFRQELMDEVLKAALTQACLEDVKAVTADVTVTFVHRDGQWWAVPDTALLTALSAGLA